MGERTGRGSGQKQSRARECWACANGLVVGRASSHRVCRRRILLFLQQLPRIPLHYCTPPLARRRPSLPTPYSCAIDNWLALSPTPCSPHPSTPRTSPSAPPSPWWSPTPPMWPPSRTTPWPTRWPHVVVVLRPPPRSQLPQPQLQPQQPLQQLQQPRPHRQRRQRRRTEGGCLPARWLARWRGKPAWRWAQCAAPAPTAAWCARTWRSSSRCVVTFLCASLLLSLWVVGGAVVVVGVGAGQGDCCVGGWVGGWVGGLPGGSLGGLGCFVVGG